MNLTSSPQDRGHREHQVCFTAALTVAFAKVLYKTVVERRRLILLVDYTPESYTALR